MIEILIEDTHYDLAALDTATLNVLYRVKHDTRTDERAGASMKDMRAVISKIAAAKFNLYDVLDTDESIHAFRALIYFLRLSAGEQVTVDEANDFPVFEALKVAWTPDDDQQAALEQAADQEAEAGPKADSDPAAATETSPKRPSSKRTSRSTSRRPSTAG